MTSADAFFEKIYHQYYRQILIFVCRLIRDDIAAVEDVVQETFFEVYKKREELISHPNIEGWLYVTARNKVKKWFRNQSKYCLSSEVMEVLEKVEEQEEKIFSEVDFYVTAEQTLNKDDQILLKSYYGDGFNIAESAKKLGISANACRVRLGRMRKKLKNGLRIGSCFWLFWMIR